mmetsp:Transcript_126085/g.353068  ORF Transcript_126085/g.353068 Transcript_126085/m.353068 type:complete len:259 (-) Transcript_126085:43-819(-)
MAPNRKNVASLVGTLSNGDLTGLQETIQQKYLPLTDPKEQLQQAANEPNAKPCSTTTSSKDTSTTVSYWDWPADAEVKEVAATTDDLFSASHIEANLKKEAAKWSATVEQEETNLSMEEHEPKRQLGTSYWDWVAEEDTKYAMINRILADERARLLVSGAAIEAMETAAAAAHPNGARPSSDRASDEYWGWNSSAEKISWDPSDGIQALLQYEEAREFLTADNIVKQLQQWNEPTKPTPLVESSNEYWMWSHQSSAVC